MTRRILRLGPLGLAVFVGCESKPAQTISVPGVNIRVSPDGTAHIQAPGVDIRADSSGANVRAPGVDVKANASGASVTAPGVDVRTGPDGSRVGP